MGAPQFHHQIWISDGDHERHRGILQCAWALHRQPHIPLSSLSGLLPLNFMRLASPGTRRQPIDTKLVREGSLVME